MTNTVITNPLTVEELTLVVLQRLKGNPSEVIYSVCRQDVAQTLAEKLLENDIKLAALSDNALGTLFRTGVDGTEEIDWQAPIRFRLDQAWDEHCCSPGTSPQTEQAQRSYTSEHRRLAPVLALARRLDIATNPEPEAIYEAGSAGFQIWCTPDDQPKGWSGVALTCGAFSKPCGFVASVSWGWEGATISRLLLETEAFDLKHQAKVQKFAEICNRPADIAWAKRKIKALFRKAGVTCPPIRVEGA